MYAPTIQTQNENSKEKKPHLKADIIIIIINFEYRKISKLFTSITRLPLGKEGVVFGQNFRC